MPTTEIARQDHGLATTEHIEALKESLPALAAAGDTEALQSIARDAEPAALLLRKRGFDSDANRIIGVKIEAEAELGELALAGACQAENKYEAMRWRVFAIAAQRGLLEARLATAMASLESELVPTMFSRQLRREGITAVPCSAVSRAVEKWRQAEGLTWKENGGQYRGGVPADVLTLNKLAALSGVAIAPIRRALGRERSQTGRRQATVDWLTARPLGEYLGADTRSWPAAARSAGGSRRPQRWLKRQLKPTGGRWDECYSRFRKTLDEFQRLAPNTDTRWDEAYSHFYALNAAIEKAVRKPALVAEAERHAERQRQ